MNQYIEAEWTWIDGRLCPDVRVEIDTNGRIAGLAAAGKGAPATRRLPDSILLPGFVNVHSHAFQRGLRGRGEEYPAGRGSFWTWREEMYRLVGELGASRLRALCAAAFTEMLRSGFTSVGEFHYLHHDRPDEHDYAFDRVVCEAAAQAGIRLVLIASAYRRGGFDRPLEPGQRWFDTVSTESFLKHIDRLRETLGPRQTLALSAHSLRSVPGDEFIALRHAARERRIPFHAHLEEQRQELDACRAATGKTPIEWCLANAEIGPDCCAVHATHTEPVHLRAWLDAGGRVCICPLTEASLADGVAHVPELAARPGALCIGSDSNARIDAIEELRWLEYVQRLAREQRGVCIGPDRNLASGLLRIGTANGAAALGLNAGSIEGGALADFCLIDLKAADLAFSEPEEALTALLVGGDKSSVRAVCVGGHWREFA